MKIVYVLMFTFFGYGAIGQIISFPDQNLKAKLLSASPTNYVAYVEDAFGNVLNVDIDINDDGDIDVNEAMAIEMLNIGDSEISSLDGIQYFVNLIDLYASRNNLTSVNYHP